MSTENETPDRARYQRIWPSLIVGVVIFGLGMFAGYFVRPFIAPDTEGADNSSAQNPPSVGADQSGNQEVMAFLTRETRHFKGDPNAPVTIIEFSDFK